jgi:hypothetical protein
MAYESKPRVGDDSPWGRVKSTKELAPGIVLVGTVSHGGIWLSPERVAALPLWAFLLRSRYGAKPVYWEEDVEIKVPLLAFYDDIVASGSCPGLVSKERLLGGAFGHFYPEVAAAARRALGLGA